MEDKEVLSVLTGLFTGVCPLDLDKLPLTDYIKSCINVEQCRLNCDLSSVCRYRDFILRAQTLRYDFQIANHNLVLADVLNRKNGRKSLLPYRGVVIFDEAHKLLDAASQMYGMTFENVEMERLVTSIYRNIGAVNPNKSEIVKLCETMQEQNSLLFEALKYAGGTGYDKKCYAQINLNCIRALKTLIAVLRRLSVLFYTTSGEKRERYDRLVHRMEQQEAKLSILFHYPQSIHWLEMTGAAVYRICALPKRYLCIFHSGQPRRAALSGGCTGSFTRYAGD